MQVLNHPRPTSDRHTYAAVLLVVRVRNLRLLPEFVAAIPAVADQAAATEGMVCYGFDVDWQRLTFTTFAVADGADVLWTFARCGEHGRLTAALAGRLGPTSVDHLRLPGTEIPRKWDEIGALRRVAERTAGAA